MIDLDASGAAIRRGRRRRLRRVTADALLLLAPVVVLAGGFLSIYLARRYSMPLGYDSGKYVWRANLVAAHGLDSLGTLPILHPNADRPGFPILAEFVTGTLGVAPLGLAVLISGVAPAVIGLSAGALAVTSFERPRWSFPVYALVVGGSANVAIMAVSHLDTLLVSAVLLAATAAILDAADGRATAAGGVVLLVGATLIHWNFVAVFAVVTAAFAAILVPESLRARRAGAPLSSLPSARVAGILGVGGILGAAAIAGLTPSGAQPPSPSRAMFVARLRGIVPSYRLAFVLPVAAAGAVLLWDGPDRQRRSLWFALLWCGSALAAAILLGLGVAVAAHRILGFALAVPFLAAAAIAIASGRLWRSGGRVGRAGATAILVGGLVLGGLLFQREWYANAPSMGSKAFAYSQTAARYLDADAANRPVVLLFDTTPGGVVLGVRTFRAAASPDRIANVWSYLGDVDELLAGRPTMRPGQAAFNAASASSWGAVRPILARDPVILTNPSFDRSYPALLAAHPDWLVAPGLLVVSGPRPPGVVAAKTPRPVSGRWLLFAGAGVLLLVGAAGAGWAWSLVPAGWFERAALAPAFGLATLVLGGTVADALGVRFAGAAAWAVAAGVAAAGWAPAIVRRASMARARVEGSADGAGR